MSSIYVGHIEESKEGDYVRGNNNIVWVSNFNSSRFNKALFVSIKPNLVW